MADGENAKAADGPACTPVPWTDAERQAALERYEILDTAKEAAFDDLAALAADILEAPIAVVNFVTADRQWFKAEVGIGADTLPLDVSICRHAILQPGIMVVPDLTVDPRFAGNPLIHVAEGLRFYAGALLETAEGVPLGTVCVLDTKARPDGITEREERALRALASQTMAQLEARLSTRKLRESEARLAFLDRLGAATAALGDADAVLATTTQMVGEHLGLSVCAYADMDEDQDGFTIRGDWAAPGAHSIVGHYQLAAFGQRAVRELGAGQPLVLNDIAAELPAEEAATFHSIGLAATICMPLVKGGRLAALMAAHDRVPRQWTDAELDLVREVTNRSWAHVERVAAVEELRTSEARFRLTADAVPQIVWITDAQGRTEFFNKQWSDYTGAAFVPSTAANVAASHVHPDDAAHTMQAFDEARRSGTTLRVEHRIRSASGAYRWFLVRAEPYHDPKSGEIVRWFGASIDIHDRRLAEAALQDSEARLRELNETLEAQVAERTAERDRVWANSRDLLLVIGTDGVFKAVNPAWTAVLGWTESELVGRTYLDFIHPDDHFSSQGALATATYDSLPTYENRYRHKDGSFRWISWVAAPEGDLIYASGRDVTAEKDAAAELEEAQGALRQSQKMEAMGQLTGGVAHDFNNLLTPIIGSLDMLNRRGVGTERERRLIDGALQSAERAKTLVQRLLAFARRQPLQPVAVNVGTLVQNMAELIASTIGPRIDVCLALADDLPPAVADANQLEMALLNLAVNARDAMADGGVLTIAAGEERRHGGRGARLAPGRYVRLSVQDTGSGMDAETLARAVEPFFSTKGIGKGTGLGLSMVHGLARQLGGDLSIDSLPGRGTSVHLWLPVSRDGIVAVEDARGTARPETRGTALLVDDEDLVRMSTADMLLDMGYEVVEARSGEEALSIVATGRAFDILVTDHLMPGINGAELARQVRAERESLPVLIVSGYAEDVAAGSGLVRLTKPFRNAELETALAAAMAAPAAATS